MVACKLDASFQAQLLVLLDAGIPVDPYPVNCEPYMCQLQTAPFYHSTYSLGKVAVKYRQLSAGHPPDSFIATAAPTMLAIRPISAIVYGK
jgi:hypothetical protein